MLYRWPAGHCSGSPKPKGSCSDPSCRPPSAEARLGSSAPRGQGPCCSRRSTPRPGSGRRRPCRRRWPAAWPSRKSSTRSLCKLFQRIQEPRFRQHSGEPRSGIVAEESGGCSERSLVCITSRTWSGGMDSRSTVYFGFSSSNLSTSLMASLSCAAVSAVPTNILMTLPWSELPPQPATPRSAAPASPAPPIFKKSLRLNPLCHTSASALPFPCTYERPQRRCRSLASRPRSSAASPPPPGRWPPSRPPPGPAR